MKHFRQFVVANTEDEAISLRKTVGTKSLFIAGGTTVVPMAGESVEVLIDISRLGLDGISDRDGWITIGATTRLSSILSPDIKAAVPMLFEALRHCATPLVRNMATLGGSLAGIYLPSDAGVALAALGAKLEMRGDEERVVPVDDLLAGAWLSGYELIRSVRIPKLGQGQGWGFSKFGRSDVDIALVNVAAVVGITDGSRISDLRLAIGQSSSKPVLLTDFGEDRGDKGISHDLIRKIAESASEQVKVKADFRASSAYRKHLVSVLAARSILAAAQEAGARLED
ncbi:MAG: FAD binding domain-containing protein [Candidatus Eisenbacteria bacterium]